MRRSSRWGKGAMAVALAFALSACVGLEDDSDTLIDSTGNTVGAEDPLHGSALSARDAAGVPTCLSDGIQQDFPGALELTDRAAPGLDGFLARTFGVEGDRALVWSVDSERVRHEGTDYEVTTVTGGANTFASVLADDG